MTRNEALAEYLGSLSSHERRAKMRDIKEKLDVSRDVVYNWIAGRTQINRVFFDEISKIVAVDLSVNVEE